MSDTVSSSAIDIDAAVDENDARFNRQVCELSVRMFVVLGMSIAQLSMAAIYRTELDECSSIVTPYVWMVLTGIMGLIQITITCQTCIYGAMFDFTEDDHFVVMLRRTNKLYEGAWMVIGSIILWRDCSDSIPKPTATLFWITLILFMCYRANDCWLFVKSLI